MWRYYSGREVPMGGSGLRFGGLFLLVACTSAAGDSAVVGLPPEDTSPFVEDTGTFPIDTSDTGAGDSAPPHWLGVRQEGTWTFGGDVGDPSSMTGTLTVTEVLDGDTLAPTCVEEWALVGERAEEDCEGCVTFVVGHTLVSADGGCRQPELPEDGEERALGWDGETVWWDWHDTGVWVPLWSGVDGKVEGEIVFEWEATIGVEGEDDTGG